ncbi:4-(cytidine 5'-diphospho)-2-C-methyl-D-erythritol kinase [Neogemmobacter tilapiae]|uniref:4-diphosphocytidyl-2-C-methyl-D-erythritol kinase n=1 Tax=Neogemmobacter tilapiae TaxID=875041 RepID=A0A918TXD0_9RHOB|nr:4-(cytidine 5'-diphospho)-2-C-methyl-D-erythritol kinase [Gemmobacter tilapiae]GHC66086.1 4-diphosphocytidyl-2-C-methyl-D-erythritol kinase [Gemmobacter tilapiae]
METKAFREFAPAKINLCLHVTGQRADGYHLLDSLVVFARDAGDWINVEPGDNLSLTVTGPRGAGLSAGDDNLVLRAARRFASPKGARITLEKHLPTASGIGGGSSDAAATLRALSRLWAMPLPEVADVLKLGADVPVCLNPSALRMQGVGEGLTAVNLPPVWAVLANPGVAIPTPQVFAKLTQKANAPLPDTLPPLPDAAALAQFLAATRNDLQAPAIALAPVIAEALQALAAQPKALIARMSGSGATCFGLFPDPSAATAAAKQLSQSHPDWWIAPTLLAPPSLV